MPPGPVIDGTHYGAVDLPGGYQAALLQHSRDVAKLVRQNSIEPRSSSCRPRIHDLRNSLADCSLLDAYPRELDIDRRLTLLATYLGHHSPADTYWYLSAATELLALITRPFLRTLSARARRRRRCKVRYPAAGWGRPPQRCLVLWQSPTLGTSTGW